MVPSWHCQQLVCHVTAAGNVHATLVLLPIPAFYMGLIRVGSVECHAVCAYLHGMRMYQPASVMSQLMVQAVAR